MENDLNKNDGLFKEMTTKINTILEKVSQDYKNSLIDPVHLEEIRKIMKVSNKF
jgi:hypothetical protein